MQLENWSPVVYYSLIFTLCRPTAACSPWGSLTMKRIALTALVAALAGCATPPPPVSPHALKLTVTTYTGAAVAAALSPSAAASLSPAAEVSLSPTAAAPSPTAATPLSPSAAVQLSPTAAEVAAIAPPKRFSMLSLPSADAATDGTLRDGFAVRLKFKGYPMDDGNPQLLVTCGHSVSPAVETEPEKHEEVRTYIQPYSESVTTMVNGAPVMTVKNVPGHWKTENKVTPAVTKQVFIKTIYVQVYSADAAPNVSPTALPLWIGSISHTNQGQDLTTDAAVMLRELSEEIPSPSGKPETRFVEP
jgi:hypothetical protein